MHKPLCLSVPVEGSKFGSPLCPVPELIAWTIVQWREWCIELAGTASVGVCLVGQDVECGFCALLAVCGGLTCMAVRPHSHNSHGFEGVSLGCIANACHSLLHPSLS